jgi:protein arginine kinase
MSKAKSALPAAFFSFTKECCDNINPFNVLTIKRNCSFYPFSHKLCKVQSQEIIKLIKKAFKKCPQIKPLFLPEAKLSPQERSLLTEHFMIDLVHQEDQIETLFILDKDAQFLAHINGENHLHLHYLAQSNEIQKGFEMLFEIEEALSKSITFSFNDKFGYLTSNPHDTGTAFNTSCYLHLPALVHTNSFEAHREKINSDIEVLGMNENQKYIGDLIHIKNRCTLGLLEKNILKQCLQARDLLIQKEMDARKSLQKNCDGKVKDKIARAFGLLSCASKLETTEALNALSLLELGKSLSWIDGLEKSDFSSLFFKTQRAHLPFFSKNIDEMQISRAELLHQELKSAKLSL